MNITDEFVFFPCAFPFIPQRGGRVCVPWEFAQGTPDVDMKIPDMDVKPLETPLFCDIFF